MATNKKNAPAYSRYHQWADAGKPYWEGVSLFNQWKRYPSLRALLNARESKNNRTKLDYMLRKYLMAVPGTPPSQQPAPSHEPKEGSHEPRATSRGPLEAALGPEVDLPWTDSKFRLPTFAQLPDVLKQARIDNMARFHKACALHAALNERITEEAHGSIHLRDALRLMHEKTPAGALIPFRYTGYTHNRRTHEGGRLTEYPEALPLVEDALPNPRTLRDRDADKKAKAADLAAKHKPGDHFRNATRDLLLPTGEKVRVIIWTMMRFNGMRVVLGTSHEPRAASHEQIEASQLVRDLVETMDAVCIAWDIERRWQQHGALPEVPEDLRTQLMKRPLHELKDMVTNSLRPRVSRWKRAADQREDDELVEAQMQLGAAESELALALEVIRMKEAAGREPRTTS